MLKILLNSLEYDKYLSEFKFIDSIGSHFNRVKQPEWFDDLLVREIIEKVDNAYVELGFSVRSFCTGQGYSVNELSGGAKSLILMHKLRDRVMLATMGDNCTELLEKIAADYEKQGKDLVIVSNYLHKFPFKHIKKIYYMNWDKVCTSWDDVCNSIYPKFLVLMKKNTE